MSAANLITGAGFGASALSSIGGGIAQSTAFGAQAGAVEAATERDKELAEFQADATIRQGNRAARQLHGQGQRFIGSQRAAAAANNVDVNTGSVALAQDDAKFITEMDEITIRNNAWKEAWGLKLAATSLEARGAFAASEARFRGQSALVSGIGRGATTILGGASNVANNFGGTSGGFFGRSRNT